MHKILGSIIFLILCLSSITNILAATKTANPVMTGKSTDSAITVSSSNGTNTASESAKPEDSFTLFWPLTAGKTSADSFYFLKIWKENIRGKLIFSSAEQANYKVFIATKRLLEAEALFNNKNKDLAENSLNEGKQKLVGASQDVINAKNNNEPLNSEMFLRLKNMNILLNNLKLASGESVPKIEEYQSEVNILLSKE
jgi:hypothetical protein